MKTPFLKFFPLLLVSLITVNNAVASEVLNFPKFSQQHYGLNHVMGSDGEFYVADCSTFSKRTVKVMPTVQFFIYNKKSEVTYGARIIGRTEFAYNRQVNPRNYNELISRWGFTPEKAKARLEVFCGEKMVSTIHYGMAYSVTKGKSENGTMSNGLEKINNVETFKARVAQIEADSSLHFKRMEVINSTAFGQMPVDPDKIVEMMRNLTPEQIEFIQSAPQAVELELEAGNVYKTKEHNAVVNTPSELETDSAQ